jgi:uncharacterized protein YcbK (DUF882 family)
MGSASKNFSYSEFTKSDTAARKHIQNEITTFEVRDNIKALVDNLLQPLRDAWDAPLFINSGYRCPELNKAVGGVATSQHVLGMAADVGCSNPYELAKLVKKLRLPFDQMGLYDTFVHLSYRDDGENRNQIFYSKNYKGKKI